MKQMDKLTHTKKFTLTVEFEPLLDVSDEFVAKSAAVLNSLLEEEVELTFDSALSASRVTNPLSPLFGNRCDERVREPFDFELDELDA